MVFLRPVLALILCSVAGNWSAAAEPLDLAPQEGILLLRGGRLLRGTIVRAGMKYYVTVPHGEIRVPAGEVELVCRTLQEAYRIKQDAIRDGDIAAHLDLADWCVRNKLHGFALQQLAVARALRPGDPRIALLERRLHLAMHPVSTPASASGSPIPRTSNDELDELVNKLPEGTVETFTTTVQPLLLNRCSRSGCHGPRSKKTFRLEHLPGGRPLTRRITQRNLETLLKYVDREDPSQSSLLTRPLNAHGGGGEVPFAARDAAKYQQLVQWVERLTAPQPERQPPTVGAVSAPLLQNVGESSGAQRPSRGPFGNRRERTAHAEGSRDGILPLHKSTKEHSELQFGAPARTRTTDPFDPDVFNRKYGTAPAPKEPAPPDGGEEDESDGASPQ